MIDNEPKLIAQTKYEDFDIEVYDGELNDYTATTVKVGSEDFGYKIAGVDDLSRDSKNTIVNIQAEQPAIYEGKLTPLVNEVMRIGK